MMHTTRQPTIAPPAVALMITLLTATSLCHAASREKSGFLADTPTNLAWERGERDDELVFNLDSGREPVIELNKAAFKDGEVSIEIRTGVSTFYFRSGTQRFDLKLEPDDKYRLTLSGKPRHETIKLSNKELIYDKPKWVSMVKADRPATFNLMFLRAREVSLRFRERGKKIKLKLPGDKDTEED